jgi:hypothetical protein
MAQANATLSELSPDHQTARQKSLKLLNRKQETAMDVYNLTEVASAADASGDVKYGFNIIGEHGRPLVNFSYEWPAEAEAAHELIAKAIVRARLITPVVPSVIPDDAPP